MPLPRLTHTVLVVCGLCNHKVRSRDFQEHADRYCAKRATQPPPTEREREIAAADLREGLRNRR